MSHSKTIPLWAIVIALVMPAALVPVTAEAGDRTAQVKKGAKRIAELRRQVRVAVRKRARGPKTGIVHKQVQHDPHGDSVREPAARRRHVDAQLNDTAKRAIAARKRRDAGRRTRRPEADCNACGVPGKSAEGGGVPGKSAEGGGVPGKSAEGTGVPGRSLDRRRVTSRRLGDKARVEERAADVERLTDLVAGGGVPGKGEGVAVDGLDVHRETRGSLGEARKGLDKQDVLDKMARGIKGLDLMKGGTPFDPRSGIPGLLEGERNATALREAMAEAGASQRELDQLFGTSGSAMPTMGGSDGSAFDPISDPSDIGAGEDLEGSDRRHGDPYASNGDSFDGKKDGPGLLKDMYDIARGAGPATGVSPALAGEVVVAGATVVRDTAALTTQWRKDPGSVAFAYTPEAKRQNAAYRERLKKQAEKKAAEKKAKENYDNEGKVCEEKSKKNERPKDGDDPRGPVSEETRRRAAANRNGRVDPSSESHGIRHDLQKLARTTVIMRGAAVNPEPDGDTGSGGGGTPVGGATTVGGTGLVHKLGPTPRKRKKAKGPKPQIGIGGPRGGGGVPGGGQGGTR